MEGGKNLKDHALLPGGEEKVGVAKAVVFLLVAFQLGEMLKLTGGLHPAVGVFVLAVGVKDQILGLAVPAGKAVAVVRDDGPVDVLRLVVVVLQVVGVVLCLEHRAVNGGLPQIEPAHRVRICLPEGRCIFHHVLPNLPKGPVVPLAPGGVAGPAGGGFFLFVLRQGGGGLRLVLHLVQRVRDGGRVLRRSLYRRGGLHRSGAFRRLRRLGGLFREGRQGSAGGRGRGRRRFRGSGDRAGRGGGTGTGGQQHRRQQKGTQAFHRFHSLSLFSHFITISTKIQPIAPKRQDVFFVG